MEILAGTVLARGLVLLLAPLLALTPFAIVGMGIGDLKPALLVLLWRSATGGARRAFGIALLAIAAGAMLDALTPSYDASAIWGWSSDALVLAAELATLGGLAFLARGANGAVLLLLMLATGTSLARTLLRDTMIGWQLVAIALASAAHLLLFLWLRKRPRAAVSPQVWPGSAGSGLFRWGLVELARIVLLGGAIILAAALSLSDRDFSRLGLGAVLLLAVVSAVGIRWLDRFADGVVAVGARAAFTRAAPLAAVVVALFIIPDVTEALLADRESALARAGIGAVTAQVVSCLALISLVSALRRAARKLELRRIARFAGVLRWLLIGLPLVMASVPVLDAMVSWETRRSLEQLTVLVLVAFGLSWLSSLVLILLAARTLRADRAPGGVGEKIAHAT